MVGTTCPGHWRLSGTSIQEEDTYIQTDSARIERRRKEAHQGRGVAYGME